MSKKQTNSVESGKPDAKRTRQDMPHMPPAMHDAMSGHDSPHRRRDEYLPATSMGRMKDSGSRGKND